MYLIAECESKRGCACAVNRPTRLGCPSILVLQHFHLWLWLSLWVKTHTRCPSMARSLSFVLDPNSSTKVHFEMPKCGDEGMKESQQFCIAGSKESRVDPSS